jgi:hypothetical protein
VSGAPRLPGRGFTPDSNDGPPTLQ